MSLIKAIKAQLGLSVTPANNFTLDASADNGTMKLSRNSGEDIMTVDAAGKVSFPQNAVYPKLIATAVFDGALTGSNAPIVGFGVTTVTRNSAGNYTINLSSTYADNNHIVSIAVDNGAYNACYWASATTSTITIINYVSGAQTNATRVHVTVHRVAA